MDFGSVLHLFLEGFLDAFWGRRNVHVDNETPKINCIFQRNLHGARRLILEIVTHFSNNL